MFDDILVEGILEIIACYAVAGIIWWWAWRIPKNKE